MEADMHANESKMKDEKVADMEAKWVAADMQCLSWICARARGRGTSRGAPQGGIAKTLFVVAGGVGVGGCGPLEVCACVDGGACVAGQPPPQQQGGDDTIVARAH
eukprot:353588-Chlamydomonas_euryale.AAC.9